MSHPVISLSSARTLHLSAQNLLKPLTRKPSAGDVVDSIQNMGLLQIDTISVVARSPYLVLFSRLGNYSPQWLEDALSEGKIFEYWAHEACFIPREDYGLLRHKMLNPQGMGWKFSQDWFDEHQADIQALLSHIAEKGPVRSADFSAEKKSNSGWWDWKPHKKHLETLFTSGKLMVSERRNFHRVYDLAERVMPGWDDAAQALSQEAAEYQMMCRSAQYLGIFKAEWLADYYRLKRVDTRKVIETLLENGEVTPVEVSGLEGKYYVHQQQFPLLQKARESRISSTVTTLLSPFDPVVWDRKRASTLFNFDYRIECYTPEAKRQYGYFTLPILQRGELVGRIDAKMHRKEKVLEVKSLHLEPEVTMTSRRAQDINGAITRFAAWQGAEDVLFSKGPEALTVLWNTGWRV
ncbi:winged helix-turn-helix domain-containing protein [Rahnella contaminans]|uniref:winged helix-turn-helix domain-containing protein n=1 Tax=Rahnella contaminans TaxID=2703882 RepID=UPI0023DC1AA1|nr:winged helix-turn-helix domain-containing protein [Rahnella contaminans]MDF1894778.1 winged helix-turn-helix domain-containing protein [Rahnella contaminans]